MLLILFGRIRSLRVWPDSGGASIVDVVLGQIVQLLPAITGRVKLVENVNYYSLRSHNVSPWSRVLCFKISVYWENTIAILFEVLNGMEWN